MTPEAACLPNPDPNERFADMTEQIFGAGLQPPSPPTMAGFVSNYMKTATNDPRGVMHGFTPEQVPVISQLARSFGVSDRWHASAPNQTWPNRFFVHTGTAAGYVNNSPVRFPYLMPTIFSRLTQCQRSWRIYFHDVPLTATLSKILSELPEHLYPFEDAFMGDAMAGRLPDYSFIEPRYFPSLAFNRMPNDQHPPHNVAYGERLIARCYDALRNGPGWEQTLFIVIYDEHGGVYDHVLPPAGGFARRRLAGRVQVRPLRGSGAGRPDFSVDSGGKHRPPARRVSISIRSRLDSLHVAYALRPRGTADQARRRGPRSARRLIADLAEQFRPGEPGASCRRRPLRTR